MPRERMERLQRDRLRAVVGRTLDAVPAIADRLRGVGIVSGHDVGSLADLTGLPFTSKADLRDAYPFGLHAVGANRMVRIHATSGTKGKLTIVGYTRNDLATWTEVVARCLGMAGVRPGMLLHNAYGYGLFTGGLGLHQGAELFGCTVLPISGGLTERQAMLLRDLGGQVLCSTPSYAISIADALEAEKVDAERLKLEIGIFGAEPWTDEMRRELERRLHVSALNIYGLAEIVGPGVSAECIEGRNGSHINEDHFLPEVVDPVSGSPLPAGTDGELVFTTLTKEALPLIRYRTGDIASLDPTACVCGRTTVRMSRLRGRYDDMLVIRGVNLYPSEVERVLLSVGDLSPHYQLIVERPHALDAVSVVCEPSGPGLDHGSLKSRLQHALHERTGLSFDVVVVERGGVPRSEGKALRVIDRRAR